MFPVWYSAPWVNFLCLGFAGALGVLGFTTPWLINKQPIKQTDRYHSVGVMVLLNFYFATGKRAPTLWPAVAFGLVFNTIVTVYAVAGAPLVSKLLPNLFFDQPHFSHVTAGGRCREAGFTIQAQRQFTVLSFLTRECQTQAASAEFVLGKSG